MVLEIGPGKGALTRPLLARCDRLFAVELDAGLAARLREQYASEPRFTLLEGDVLALDFAALGAAVVCGNLPYYITSPIIERTLTAGGGALQHAVFLVQKEVAERIAAAPGSRDYGYFSAFVQFHARPELLFTVPPGAFAPPPKVDSAVIRLTLDPAAPRLGIADPAAFLKFLQSAFAHKRKTLRNNLAGIFGKAAVDAHPEAGLRAEQLSLPQFAALYQRLIS